MLNFVLEYQTTVTTNDTISKILKYRNPLFYSSFIIPKSGRRLVDEISILLHFHNNLHQTLIHIILEMFAEKKKSVSSRTKSVLKNFGFSVVQYMLF